MNFCADDITVCIPSIPSRTLLLHRAVESVLAQTHPAAAVSIARDLHREGGAATRQRALEAVRTPWVAFLDDDDEMMPEHLEKLFRHAQETNADYVYSWFETVPNGRDPFPPNHFTDPFNPSNPIETTITILVRTEIANRAGGFQPHFEANEEWPGEDRRFTLACIELGANIQHLPERTWYWHHDSNNTSGLASRWS